MKITSITADGITLSFENDKDRHRTEDLARCMAKGFDMDLHWRGPLSGDWWKRWDNVAPGARGRSFDVRTFTVTEDHLALVRRSCTGWQYCEFGAMEINPKRPYGNSGVLYDIAEMIGLEPDADGEFTPEQEVHMLRLHRETQVVFQIAMCTGSFQAGDYVNTCESFPYGRPAWERAA